MRLKKDFSRRSDNYLADRNALAIALSISLAYDKAMKRIFLIAIALTVIYSDNGYARDKGGGPEIIDELFKDPTSPVGGNPNGDVTIVEFFDYQCGYCKWSSHGLKSC